MTQAKENAVNFHQAFEKWCVISTTVIGAEDETDEPSANSGLIYCIHFHTFDLVNNGGLGLKMLEYYFFKCQETKGAY